MRVFFDTEFLENGSTIRLISIGMVREDGVELYAETLEAAAIAGSDDWLRANVKPHLRGRGATMSPLKMAYKVREFAGENPEFWAYYADYDWVVLCQLFGRMIDLPRGWPRYCRDVKQEADRLNATLPKQDTAEHDALADAMWTRDAHAYLTGPATVAARLASKA